MTEITPSPLGNVITIDDERIAGSKPFVQASSKVSSNDMATNPCADALPVAAMSSAANRPFAVKRKPMFCLSPARRANWNCALAARASE